MTRYLVPAAETRAEIQVSNSRFIATAAPALTVDDAKSSIARVRAGFADASHNVSAFLVGHGSSVIAHCHDDGEPGGTAGRPILAVLRGSGLGDVVLVVTRYFGGTKLGTGGLVRAYGDSAREVLAVLPLAEKVPTHIVSMAAPYPLFERVRLALVAHGGQILSELFGVGVTITARITFDQLPRFQAALVELSNGALVAEIIDTNPATLIPLAEGGS